MYVNFRTWSKSYLRIQWSYALPPWACWSDVALLSQRREIARCTGSARVRGWRSIWRNSRQCSPVWQCYAHGNVFKLRGWFGNLWRASWSWPRPGHHLVRFLFFPDFLLSAVLWGVESFTLAAPLRCDRVEVLRCGDGSKTMERSLSWQILGRNVNALPDFSGFLFSLWITYYGPQSTVYVNLAPCTGYLPLV